MPGRVAWCGQGAHLVAVPPLQGSAPTALIPVPLIKTVSGSCEADL